MRNARPSGTLTRIADAAIRVIARDGFDRMSVRTVATEADLAPGTVQHHFASREALLTGALERTIQRQLDRIVARSRTEGASAFYQMRDAILEVMPLDDTRREEAIVWLAFSAAASTRPALHDAHRSGVTLIRSMIHGALERDARQGNLRRDIDIDRETILLAATIDGLLLHGINAQPEDQGIMLDAVETVLSRLYGHTRERGDTTDCSSNPVERAPESERKRS